MSDIPANEVLSVVRKELLRLEATDPDELADLVSTLDAAISEVDNDMELSGAIALATLLDVELELNLKDLDSSLDRFRRLIPTAGDIRDVIYTDTGLLDGHDLSLRESLSKQSYQFLPTEIRAEAEAFIKVILELSDPDPGVDPDPHVDPNSDSPGDPSPTSSPPRGPRR